MPYWSHGFPDAPYWDIDAYKERSNSRYRKAMKVTRKFGKMVYKVAWGGMIIY